MLIQSSYVCHQFLACHSRLSIFWFICSLLSTTDQGHVTNRCSKRVRTNPERMCKEECVYVCLNISVWFQPFKIDWDLCYGPGHGVYWCIYYLHLKKEHVFCRLLDIAFYKYQLRWLMVFRLSVSWLTFCPVLSIADESFL